MRGRAFWALLSGAAVLLVSSAGLAQCTKDTDCKGDRVCDAGKCTSPAPPAAPPADGATAAGTTPADAGAAAPAPAVAQPPAASGAPAAATAPLGPSEPETRRRSRGAMVGGILMVAVAPIALLASLSSKGAQDRCDRDLQADYPNHQLPTSEKYRVEDCNSYSVPVYLFGIGGAVLLAGGVPLIIYGAKTVPAQPTTGRLQVLPWAGPESAGLRLRLDM